MLAVPAGAAMSTTACAVRSPSRVGEVSVAPFTTLCPTRSSSATFVLNDTTATSSFPIVPSSIANEFPSWCTMGSSMAFPFTMALRLVKSISTPEGRPLSVITASRRIPLVVRAVIVYVNESPTCAVSLLASFSSEASAKGSPTSTSFAALAVAASLALACARLTTCSDATGSFAEYVTVRASPLRKSMPGWREKPKTVPSSFFSSVTSGLSRVVPSGPVTKMDEASIEASSSLSKRSAKITLCAVEPSRVWATVTV